jgi:hypothetical protein
MITTLNIAPYSTVKLNTRKGGDTMKHYRAVVLLGCDW